MHHARYKDERRAEKQPKYRPRVCAQFIILRRRPINLLGAQHNTKIRRVCLCVFYYYLFVVKRSHRSVLLAEKREKVQ